MIELLCFSENSETDDVDPSTKGKPRTRSRQPPSRKLKKKRSRKRKFQETNYIREERMKKLQEKDDPSEDGGNSGAH